jgi:hypothetical protein
MPWALSKMIWVALDWVEVHEAEALMSQMAVPPQ